MFSWRIFRSCCEVGGGLVVGGVGVGRGVGRGVVGGGGRRVVWEGRRMVKEQHGPLQLGIFRLSADVRRPEHLTCSQLLQAEHWMATALAERFLLHLVHAQVGPGFGSIPVLISRSLSHHAGVGCLVVGLVKNS